MAMRFVAITACLSVLLACAARAEPRRAPPPSAQPASGVGITRASAPGTVFRDCGGCSEMVVLPAGQFTMGTPESEAGRSDNEYPPHAVTIPAPFALGRTPVTRGEYAAFIAATHYDTNRGTRPGERGCYVDVTLQTRLVDPRMRSWDAPGFPQGDRHPAVCVNAADVAAYVAWLAARTGQRYRLPTEAEWEYAARAGTTGPQYWAGGLAEACAYANIADDTYARRLNPRQPDDMRLACSDGFGFTAPVASFRANPFGLYDMLGNVEQMTSDCPTVQRPGEAPVTPCRWSPGAYGRGPFVRGAAWTAGPHRMRAGARLGMTEGVDRDGTVGFRVARDLAP